MILLLIFGMLAGFFKAVRDTIAHHWERSIFNEIKNVRLREWLRSDWKDKPDHFIAPLWDGWHFSDFCSYVSFCGLAYYASCYGNWFRASFIFLALMLITFTIFYHKIFVREI